MANPFVSVVVTGTSGEIPATLQAQTYSDCEVVVSHSRNQGVSESVGEFIAFLDNRDLWLPDKLQVQLAILNANPGLNWSYCGQETGLRSLLLNNFIPSSSVIVRRTTLSETGDFDDANLCRFCEDWDMWLRLAASNRAALAPAALVCQAIRNPPVEEFFNNRKRVVEAAVARCPRLLKDLRSEALARVCISAGNAYLLSDNRTEARDKFAEALTYSPLRPDAYLSWISSFLPTDAQQQIRDLHNLGRHGQPDVKSANAYSMLP